MKVNKKYLNAILLLGASIVIASCNTPIDSTSISSSNDETSSLVSDSEILSSSSVDEKYIDDGEFSIHTDHQNSFISSANYSLKYNSNLAVGKTDWSRPKVLNFKAPDRILDTDYTVRYSDNENFKTYLETSILGNTFSLTNLKINTTYYWYAYAEKDGITDTSKTHKFHTADECPRNINIDGVENSRDMGGWTIEGTDKHIKQGMVYRTGRLHDYSEVSITEEGIKTMSDVLGVKTEIDLRLVDEAGEKATKIPGGKYFNFPMNYNNGFFADQNNLKAVKNVFKIFTNKNNYPVFFHCAIGTDRTGWIAFLLNGLLGVSQDALLRDYLFSNFANIGGGRTKADIETYISTLATKYPDKPTLKEQIEQFILDLGITVDQITTIRNLLIS